MSNRPSETKRNTKSVGTVRNTVCVKSVKVSDVQTRPRPLAKAVKKSVAENTPNSSTGVAENDSNTVTIKKVTSIPMKKVVRKSETTTQQKATAIKSTQRIPAKTAQTKTTQPKKTTQLKTARPLIKKAQSTTQIKAQTVVKTAVKTPVDPIEKLAGEILAHKRAYYSGEQVISDKEYDALEAKLAKMAPNHPVLNLVWSDEKTKGKDVLLDPPMLSLEKVFHVLELQKILKQGHLVVSDKLDGMSSTLYFEEGKFIKASTGGSHGKYGQDISLAAFHVDFPKVLEMEGVDIDSIDQIRGEMVIPTDVFGEYSKWAQETGESNANYVRNAVSGLMCRKTLHPQWIKRCWFVAYAVVRRDADGTLKEGINDTYKKDLDMLDKMGFRIPTYAYVQNTIAIDDLGKALRQRIESQYDDDGVCIGAYDIDGQVLRLNMYSKWHALGFTGHHPRGSIAFKMGGEDTEQAETCIKSIEYAVTRMGVISFVAILDPPVQLGATITRATLHNYEHVIEKGYIPGARVNVERRGEIIPKVVMLLEHSKKKWKAPTECPSCEGKLERYSCDLVCTNSDCPAKYLKGYVHMVKTLNIRGVSEKTIEAFLNHGIITAFSDLWKLTADDISTLERFGEKSAGNILDAIEEHREVELATFLQALNISLLGKKKSQELAEYCGTLERVREACVDELIELDGWNTTTALSIVSGLRDKSEIIDDLLTVLTVKPLRRLSAKEKKANTKAEIVGKSFAITGSMDIIRSRKEWEECIKTAGGKIASSISRNTNYLVTNEDSGSAKSVKAKQLGVAIITEEELAAMFN